MSNLVKNINLWGVEIPEEYLSSSELNYLRLMPTGIPSVRWIWDEMDGVWDSYELDNTSKLEGQPVEDFYRHPVWLVNGIFTMVDEVSIFHRKAIASFIGKLNVDVIADYGGGLGVLAREIAKTDPKVHVSIIEPFPRKLAIVMSKEFGDQISYETEIDDGRYDLIIAQDVLEHVEEPIDLALGLSEKVRKGGYLIFANCFYPVIKCHLPKTFHLRHTFKYIMIAAGLEYLGRIPGAEHALVFKKNIRLNSRRARIFESLSKYIGIGLNVIRGR